MRLLEVTDIELDPVQSAKLVGLVEFLSGRAQDSASKAEISQEAFIRWAQRLGINVTTNNLQQLMDQDPLKNLTEPFDPNSGKVVFRGGEQTDTGMPVDKARDIVANMAKRANPLS